MDHLVVKPPKVKVHAPKGDFWKQIGMIIIGTTISLILTIWATKLIENIQRAKDRRLSAMMVMSNIERFSRLLDENVEYMASADSIATWLLSKPVEELELMPEDELNNLINKSHDLLFITYDKSAENIFSNNIETWKNMGNVQFIDQVGEVFSGMNMVEERWNKWVTEVESNLRDIKDHPENYEGTSVPIKCLQSEQVRRNLRGIHYWRSWLTYMSATMRYHNRQNMSAIDISEQEVMDYTNFREQETVIAEDAPDFNDYYSGPISPDSLTTMSSLDERLAQLKSK
ncbi:MAG: hypothetical protein IJ785_08035 [Bacteroidales bacterium]|nr:hypothetical protein [Bacteroidales bacterium]